MKFNEVIMKILNFYENMKLIYRDIMYDIFIDEDIENQVVINTYEEYDLMYAPLFYNEYKQLLYRNYFIGE